MGIQKKYTERENMQREEAPASSRLQDTLKVTRSETAERQNLLSENLVNFKWAKSERKSLTFINSYQFLISPDLLEPSGPRSNPAAHQVLQCFSITFGIPNAFSIPNALPTKNSVKNSVQNLVKNPVKNLVKKRFWRF